MQEEHMSSRGKAHDGSKGDWAAEKPALDGNGETGEKASFEAKTSGGSLTERLDKLGQTLEERDRKLLGSAKAGQSSDVKGYAQAFKLSSEFIAGVLVGAAIGFLLDQWAGTKPWGLIVFLLLGFGAGVLNVLRSVGKVAEPERRMNTPTRKKD